MGARFSVDADRAVGITSQVQAAAEEAGRAAVAVDAAFDALADAGVGSAVISAALTHFSADRQGTARAVAEHLSTVGHVGRSAVVVVAQADAAAADAATTAAGDFT